MTAEEQAMQKAKVKSPSFLSKIFAKKSHVSEIEKAINKGNENITAPSETEEAKEKYDEKDPEVAQFLREADIALEKNDLRVAEELAINALSADKRCARAYEMVGRVAMLRGSFEEARESYKTALKCNPELAEAYFGIGQIDLKNENFTDAIVNLQRAVILDRSNAVWYGELGETYLTVRQYAKAAKALKRATSLDIDNKRYKELAAEAEEKQRAHSAVYRVK
jgi:tetratricopeptide (TPR) repeat protein